MRRFLTVGIFSVTALVAAGAHAGLFSSILAHGTSAVASAFSDSNAKQVPAKDPQGCQKLVAYGAPVAEFAGQNEGAQYLCRGGYYMQHSAVTKGALWVAEFLEASAIYGQEPRTNDFQPDPALPGADRATLGDYKGSGFDRGHYAPAADFSNNPEHMSESFYLSNMGPQEPTHNRGIWADVEKYTRQIASTSKRGLYVVTGPVFDIKNGSYIPSDVASACPAASKQPGCTTTFIKKSTIGRKRVMVPNAYYKVLLDPARGEAIAFVIPNMPMTESRDIKPWLRTVREVEQMTHLNFHSSMDSKLKATVETREPTLWRK